MTTARAAQIDYSATRYYHLMNRCVRRSYLCGTDSQTGKDYSHRKQWLVDRMKYLAGIFSVHICAYAVMSNHYHIVLYVNTDLAQSWSPNEILLRWTRLFGPSMGKHINKLDLISAEKKVEELRIRLSSLSWYMRCLNEPIARRANREDEVDGRFWQGRFKSQALLDEGAVLSAMAYVDLNPIRANQAETPETSEFTSIYERIQSMKEKISSELMPFIEDETQETPNIDFKFEDYLALVDTTGRIFREDKPGRILENYEPILDRLNLKSCGWLKMVKHLQKGFYCTVGHQSTFSRFARIYRVRSPFGKKMAEECYKKAG